MKNLKIYSLILAGLIGLVTSCKDDSLVLVPEWESAVHGLGEVTSANSDFLYNDPAQGIDVDLQWISIDRKLTVTRIDVYALFNENYIDQEGNPKVASHGGAQGKLLATFQGNAVPANRTPVSLSVTQEDLYELYDDATFDYDGPGGNPAVSVFTYKPQRNATQRFMWDDAIKLRWEFTTDDGRVFSNWGISVCTEFPGANCSVDFGVVCATDIENPGANGGQYELAMTDTYGDGWNGAAIKVIIDGVATNYTLASGASGLTVVSVPPAATTLKFEFVSGDWDSEVIFTIKSPKGNIIGKGGPSPAVGPIKLDLCLE